MGTEPWEPADSITLVPVTHSVVPTPVAPLGSIPAILSSPQDSQYPWSQRVSFAKDIASGMVSDQPLAQVAQSAMRYAGAEPMGKSEVAAVVEVTTCNP